MGLGLAGQWASICPWGSSQPTCCFTWVGWTLLPGFPVLSASPSTHLQPLSWLPSALEASLSLSPPLFSCTCQGRSCASQSCPWSGQEAAGGPPLMADLGGVGRKASLSSPASPPSAHSLSVLSLCPPLPLLPHCPFQSGPEKKFLYREFAAIPSSKPVYDIQVSAACMGWCP